jgi:hypothetical protein
VENYRLGAIQNEKQEWFRYSLLGCLTSEEKRVNILAATPGENARPGS